MRVREYDAPDLDQLSTFRCSDGSAPQNEVQNWVRRKVRGWLNSNGGHRLFVLESDDSSLAGFVAIEPGNVLDGDDTAGIDGQPLERFYVLCMGIQSEVKDLRAGRRLLKTVLAELALETPSAMAFWKVHCDNEPALKMTFHLDPDEDTPAPIAIRGRIEPSKYRTFALFFFPAA